MSTKITVLGAGFGGMELSTILSESLGDKVQVTLIDKSDAFIFGFSQLLFLYVVVSTIRSGKAADQKQWEGADSLEWTHLPTPVPYHTFETAPVIK